MAEPNGNLPKEEEKIPEKQSIEEVVEGVKGMSATLNDDKTYKRDKLLKIPKDTIKITDSTHTTKPNVIKQATKQHKQHLILKADDIKEETL